MVIESALYSLLALFFWAATIDFVSCLEVTTPVGPLHNRGPAIRLMTILLVCTHGTAMSAQPYVSRGPRPAICRGPFRHDGAVGPEIFKLVTTPSPMAAAIFASSCACTNRSCVAHAVDSRMCGDLLAHDGLPPPKHRTLRDARRPPAALR
ncbi:Uncharacterised protein [Mycobacteroides abscessus subsp. abscessus]|nr:Uncharacterised protein [Mycobacteroides abscessus subsp. abscessus]